MRPKTSAGVSGVTRALGGGATVAAGASFAGDSLYEPASGSNSVAIARKATTMTYTGTTTGGPNKTVVLSAVLKDATGKALGGRQIVFILGSQRGDNIVMADVVRKQNLDARARGSPGAGVSTSTFRSAAWRCSPGGTRSAGTRRGGMRNPRRW